MEWDVSVGVPRAIFPVVSSQLQSACPLDTSHQMHALHIPEETKIQIDRYRLDDPVVCGVVPRVRPAGKWQLGQPVSILQGIGAWEAIGRLDRLGE